MGILHPDSSYRRLCIYTSTTDIIMLIRELTEAPAGSPGYGQEGKPEWFDRAVQLKKNNPKITAKEIAKQVGVSSSAVMYWLTGKDSISRDGVRRMMRPKDSFPFKPGDFIWGGQVGNQSGRKYFDGAKPDWYVQAVKMAKAGETFEYIGKKVGVSPYTIGTWLVKGRKDRHGKIINPDAPLDPRRKGNQLNPRVMNDVQKLLKYPVDNDNIVQYIKGKYDDKTASVVKNMLPELRKKQNPGTQVIDKTRTGSMRDPDITGLV